MLSSRAEETKFSNISKDRSTHVISPRGRLGGGSHGIRGWGSFLLVQISSHQLSCVLGRFKNSALCCFWRDGWLRHNRRIRDWRWRWRFATGIIKQKHGQSKNKNHKGAATNKGIDHKANLGSSSSSESGSSPREKTPSREVLLEVA